MEKIVFLFSTVRPAKPYFFPFSGQSLGALQARWYSSRTQAASVDWQSPLAEELISAVYPSTLMRSLMTAQIVARHAPEGCEVLCTNIPHIRNSTVVVDKYQMNTRRLLLYLKMLGNRVLVDLVDGRFKPDRLALVDGIICCTRKGERAYMESQHRVPVHFVQHCLDPRLPKVAPPADKLRPWYFGAPQNLLLPETLREKVGVSYTDDAKIPVSHWLGDLPKSNFHYAVRGAMKSYTYKPFLKGFIAAHCGANIMVHEDDGDARYYLGEDYPYLVRGPINDESIAACLAKAEQEFGGPEWQRGLAIMQNIRDVCTDEVVARQFWNMALSYGKR